jgi:hypothetical protein
LEQTLTLSGVLGLITTVLTNQRFSSYIYTPASSKILKNQITDHKFASSFAGSFMKTAGSLRVLEYPRETVLRF